MAKARAIEEAAAKRLASRPPTQAPAPAPERPELDDDYWG